MRGARCQAILELQRQICRFLKRFDFSSKLTVKHCHNRLPAFHARAWYVLVERKVCIRSSSKEKLADLPAVAVTRRRVGEATCLRSN